MTLDVVSLAKQLISFPTPSQVSNESISDFLVDILTDGGCTVERLSYQDESGVAKVSLVARKGNGEGGLGLFSHSDTVPANEEVWSPFLPVVEDGRLIGRGSCDMKGPLAATVVAAANADPDRLARPLYVVVTADEEIGFGGARQVMVESRLLKENMPDHGVVAEPTELVPVYAHKGGMHFMITATGRSAHTSTDRGISANLLMAPFLAEMAELAESLRGDERFRNDEFDPPTNGFNMTIDDGGCKLNVTAAKTVCGLSIRTMPDDHHEEVKDLIEAATQRYGFEFAVRGFEPFYVAQDAPIVKAALTATGLERAQTVPFGTEALVYQDHLQSVILGPGNIAQAHTVGEWIDVAQLQRAVDVYEQMIHDLCED